MKYSELPIKTLEDIRNDKTFLICSEIITNEENQIEKIEKCLVNVSDLATKNEIIALTEQNSKLVKIISQLTTRTQEIERVIVEIKDNLNKSEESSIDSILEQINSLSERLDNNVVEL